MLKKRIYQSPSDKMKWIDSYDLDKLWAGRRDCAVGRGGTDLLKSANVNIADID